MAAGRAAELGAKVVLIEKNRSLGKKLLMTGGGRCNISQAEFNDKKFVEKLGKKGQFLLSALSVFGPEETVKFFEEKGLRTKTERGKRIFPASDNARDVLDVLLEYLKKNKVKLSLGQEIAGFNAKKGKIESVKLKNGEISARSFVLCTGGKSYPKTGSTGDGYEWAREIGHKIINPAPALAPIETEENWVKDVQGLSLKNVSVALFQNNKKQDSRFGEMLFTHFGLSGPIILDLSKKIGELLAAGEVILKIDLKPALDILTLDKRLQRDFKGNRNFKNYLPELLPQKLCDLVARFAEISPDKKLNSITKEERKKLIGALKGLKLTAKRSVGFSRAIVTSGGVDLKEIDSKTMRSKIISNLFFAGEIIDLDGPTGGYNLQICWSTGHAAGTNANRQISAIV
ncbi:NAD(P)/FAD-dependent oxidoreductase [Patescibacteria group bacterium]|nr:NAD(P)/FAD-dependent oxidoreductase [Patescibacteria group bacterium]MBU4353352.1 NAD(P)/FAD-dependent oxidoreductase [Patescibacteria group bacterium]